MRREAMRRQSGEEAHAVERTRRGQRGADEARRGQSGEAAHSFEARTLMDDGVICEDHELIARWKVQRRFTELLLLSSLFIFVFMNIVDGVAHVLNDEVTNLPKTGCEERNKAVKASTINSVSLFLLVFQPNARVLHGFEINVLAVSSGTALYLA